MTNREALHAARQELDRLDYALECTPGVYENPGMRGIYQKRFDWLLAVTRLAETALKNKED